MVSFFDLSDLFGTVLIIFSIFFLALGICKAFVSDTTLYDLELLPPNDKRKLTYNIEPTPAEGPTPFPTVFEDPEVYVSFVVPAYNEEKRLPSMLDETIEYLKNRASESNNFTWEIIIVDDGSRDRTAKVALSYSERYPQVLLLRQPHNMGKGAAIQAGCLHARGKLILMVDADGATKIDEFGALERKLLELYEINKEVIVVGSRAHLEGQNKAQRTFIRKFLGLGFHMLIVMSGVVGIHDTQCGFKLFSREAARWLFPNQHIQRWCFDPELLVIGRKRGMEIAEIPVEWNEIEGSKMKVSSMIKMAIDLIQIAVFHRTGIWTVKMKGNVQMEE
ncbi:glycosyl transferase [Histomonas meleagridis]|uniref:glycosyl transferase n=1 Tax=Histomonas meleagridis TaxID=135588 RepID=UPI0035596F97|nr:glycosyl transferase [Histomonas meleagridis]KAH0803789.1 glycosyl transferase [Histomonas meleagridis]